MKTELVRFLFPLTVLLLGGAVEDSLPKVLSVGFPVLMAAALLLAAELERAESVLFAIACGLAEDALCGLPLATTASFLVLAALCVRVVPVASAAAVAAYPVYQLWLVVWTSLPAGELWGRLFLSLPVAAVTVLALRPLLLCVERRVFDDAR